ncbi:hypothetical protein HOG21_02585 [bacterium]|nr:hypothetical protein [bacterium]
MINIFSVKAPYHGHTSTIFFHSIYKVLDISSNTFSSTRKFCQSAFFAFILYFLIISINYEHYELM